MTNIKFFLITIFLILAFNANASISVCFTPGENCAAEIVNEINTAKNTVLVQAYSFTSAPIAKALVDAKKRGVDVKVILDKSQSSQRYSSSHYLARNNINTWFDFKHAIAHNKIIIIDDKEVITGSFNFTKAAQEKNAENLLIIKDADLVKKYVNNWHKHQDEASVYESKRA
jgi:phosphatidylserine/phosphatidylglycerophosphate/cardiolipin synthase-like enzyme